jgi:hypothetical protein
MLLSFRSRRDSIKLLSNLVIDLERRSMLGIAAQVMERTLSNSKLLSVLLRETKDSLSKFRSSDLSRFGDGSTKSIVLVRPAR